MKSLNFMGLSLSHRLGLKNRYFPTDPFYFLPLQLRQLFHQIFQEQVPADLIDALH